MGQLCSCTRAQDKRAREFMNSNILPRNPSARSNSYPLNNSVKMPPSDVVRPGQKVGSRLPTREIPFQESENFNKLSSAAEQSTKSDGVSNSTPKKPCPSQPIPIPPRSSGSPTKDEQTTYDKPRELPEPSKHKTTILEKSSSAIDFTLTSQTDADLDLRASVSLGLESNCGGKSDDASDRKGNNGSNRGDSDDHLELQGQKIRTVLQRTVEIMASEIDGASMAEYLQRSRPGLEMTETCWAQCCNQSASQDLIWDIITGQEQENYNIFCNVIGSRIHLQHLVDLLQTLDSLIALLTPVDYEDYEAGGRCSFCDCATDRGAETSDFDLDLVFCHKEITSLSTLTVVSITADDRSLNQQHLIDSSNVSLAGGSFLPSVTSDELGQLNVPMLSFSLINFCLCRGRRTDLLHQVLEQSGCLRELTLIKTHVDEERLAVLLQAIRTNSSLDRLDLRLSSFGNEAAGQLGLALRHNSSLRFLNVASTGLSDIGCSRLVSQLVRNRALADIDVGFNDIRDIGCLSIAETLVRSTSLRKVRMRDNGITSYGASALFQSLARNCRLTFLDISSNGIGNDSVRHLAEALISNRTLRELNLENCRISHEGCTAIARALRANTALRNLQLSLNPITDAGLEALADGLRYNHAVETLSVNMCNVANSGFLRLLDALRFNCTICLIKLCYNNIGTMSTHIVADGDASPSLEEIFARLYETLHYNPKLKVLLWGNDLERNYSLPEPVTNADPCLRGRPMTISKSSSYSPFLSSFRQDVLVSV